MRMNIIFIHSIELCSWLPEKFLPLYFGCKFFSHTNANDSKYIVRLDELEMLYAYSVARRLSVV